MPLIFFVSCFFLFLIPIFSWRVLFSSSTRPSVRYSHCAASLDTSLFVSHGYYYESNPLRAMIQSEISVSSIVSNETVVDAPVWKDDTWIYTQKEQKWRKIEEKGERRPIARYGAVCVGLEGNVYMHGGDDGGNRWGKKMYESMPMSGRWINKNVEK